MALISWRDNYSVGVSVIDNQHKRLFELVNELHDCMIRGAANQALDAVLERLIQYTKTHFADEEDVMRRAGFPGLAAHKAKHDQLTADVLNLQERFRAGKMGISIEVLRFLRGWLDHHINGSDKEIGAYLARTKAS